MDSLRRAVGRNRAGRGSAPADGERDSLVEVSPENTTLVARALPHTMTGPLRLQATIEAVRYCARREIAGAFVECGVWRGGSILAMILALQELAAPEREMFLYDTFEGMTRPTEADTSSSEGSALAAWQMSEERGERAWANMFGSQIYDEHTVLDTLLETNYSRELIHIVKGPVEETIPGQAPQQIALLRLDTDWYESTKHELEHLYPRLAPGGVLIIDDYGHWEGARRAVDEYFSSQAQPLLLNRIDYTGRIAVKY